MEKNKIDMFIAVNHEYFSPNELQMIKSALENLPDDKLMIIQTMNFQKPDTIFLIAILLGWERFWLDDAGLGILKLLTAGGCGIWWLVDIFSAKDRAKKYNFNKIRPFLS